MILFIVLAFTTQNSLVFRDGCLKDVWNVRIVCIKSIGIVNLLIVNVHFNIWKNWMHYVVYIGNSSYFFVISCFSGNNRLIFVLLFSLTLVCIVTTSFDKFELLCQKRLSQIYVILPMRLKFKLYAVFIKSGSWINFLFMPEQDVVKFWDFPSKISRHYHKRLVPKFVWHDQREMFVKMSLRDRLDCLVGFVGLILLCLLPLRNCFFSLLSHTLCCCLERCSTANNLSNLWCSKLQHVSTYSFCRWYISTQKGNCSSTNNLCKSPRSPSPLSSNRSTEWNLYLSGKRLERFERSETLCSPSKVLKWFKRSGI